MNADTPASSRSPRPRQGPAPARLLITIPALLTLFTLATGVACYLIVFQSDTRLSEDAANHLRILIVAASCVAALSGYALALTIVKPLRRIEARLQDMAATGRVEPLPGADRLAPELDRLGRRFDQVLTSLNSYVTQRNRYILECFTGGLTLLDRDGAVMTMNSAAEALLGPEARGLTGRNFEQWLRAADPESPLAEAIRVAVRERVYADSREMELATPSRGRLPIIVSITPIQAAEHERHGLAINFRDLTAFHQFSQQMDRADRLAAIGTFATGMAHEIRNPLGSVKGMAQLLAEELDELESNGGRVFQPANAAAAGESGARSRAREYVEVIIRESNRLNTVVRSLLDFAKPESGPAQAADLNRLLAEAAALTRSYADAGRLDGIAMAEEYARVAPVWVQPERVVQALVNIVRNAVEATPEGGAVRLATREAVTENGVRVVEARIANTGAPIPPEARARIFEPFYTTKDSGTGLGLAIASQIVTTNGGQIHVDCAGAETVFTVRFPAQQ